MVAEEVVDQTAVAKEVLARAVAQTELAVQAAPAAAYFEQQDAMIQVRRLIRPTTDLEPHETKPRFMQLHTSDRIEPLVAPPTREGVIAQTWGAGVSVVESFGQGHEAIETNGAHMGQLATVTQHVPGHGGRAEDLLGADGAGARVEGACWGRHCLVCVTRRFTERMVGKRMDVVCKATDETMLAVLYVFER